MSRPGPSATLRRTAHLGLIVVGLAIVWAAAAATGDKRMSESPAHYRSAGMQVLDPGTPLTLRITTVDDGLKSVGVRFGTYGDTIACDLRVRLLAVPGSRPLSQAVVPCAELTDNAVTDLLQVPALRDNGSSSYELSLELLETPERRGAPAVMLGERIGETGQPPEPVVVLQYEAAGFLDQMAEATRRIAEYGPPWGQRPALVTLMVGTLGCITLLVMRPRLVVPLLIALALIRGLLWSALLPPLEGMDEPAHYAYAEHLVVTGDLAEPYVVGSGRGFGSPQMNSLLLELHSGAVPPSDRGDFIRNGRQLVLEDVEEASRTWDGTTPAGSYPPLYYLLASAPLRVAGDPLAGAHMARLASVALGVAGAVLAWLFARRLLPDLPLVGHLIGASALLQPMTSHQFAIVNNDALIIAAGAGSLWAAACLVDGHDRTRWLFLGALFAGLGLLAKPFAALLVVPVVVGYVLGWKQTAHSRRWLVRDATAGLAGGLLTYGAWTGLRLLLDLPNPRLLPPIQGADDRGILAYARIWLADDAERLRATWTEQLWGNFSWLDAPLPQTVYDCLWWLTIAVALGAMVWTGLRLAEIRRTRTAAVRRSDAMLTLCVVTVVTTLAGLHAAEFAEFRNIGQVQLLQGRYALAVLPAMLALPVLLVHRLTQSGNCARWTAALMLASMVGLQVLAWHVLVERFYT